jgi:putative toxin-antitoxin system antitoxin component (TIGR02293 family)
MEKQLEFYDAKAKRKFKSSDYKFEKRTTAKGTAYYAIAHAPESGNRVSVKVPARVAQPHLIRESKPAGTYHYASLVGVKEPSLVAIVDKIEDGLPYRAFEQLTALLDTPAGTLAEYLRIPARTLQRRRRSCVLSVDESERILRLSRLYQAALDLFEGDHKAAVAWLGRKNRALIGRMPVEMAALEVTGEQALQLIGRLEHGVYS